MKKKKKKNNNIWKKIGLPNPPDNKNQYILSSLGKKPIWLEAVPVE